MGEYSTDGVGQGKDWSGGRGVGGRLDLRLKAKGLSRRGRSDLRSRRDEGMMEWPQMNADGRPDRSGPPMNRDSQRGSALSPRSAAQACREGRRVRWRARIGWGGGVRR